MTQTSINSQKKKKKKKKKHQKKKKKKKKKRVMSSVLAKAIYLDALMREHATLAVHACNIHVRFVQVLPACT
jgi:hypothetical protein